MPTISMFFGIMIRMYYAPEEHNPPHIHALYQGAEAVFAVRWCGNCWGIPCETDKVGSSVD
jgi:hypothetical protein